MNKYLPITHSCVSNRLLYSTSTHWRKVLKQEIAEHFCLKTGISNLSLSKMKPI